MNLFLRIAVLVSLATSLLASNASADRMGLEPDRNVSTMVFEKIGEGDVGFGLTGGPGGGPPTTGTDHPVAGVPEPTGGLLFAAGLWLLRRRR